MTITNPSENLKIMVDSIPNGGEWWKRSTGESYQRAAKKLVELGMGPVAAVNFLSELYSTTAAEFGS